MLKNYLKFVPPFLLGFLLGWLVVGWWLWPVRWINTDPWDLKLEFKKHYILMAADSYTLNGDIELLRKRFRGWSQEELVAIVSQLKQEYSTDMRVVSRLDELKRALNLPEPGVAPKPSAFQSRPFIILLFFAVFLTLVLVYFSFKLVKDKLLKVSAKPAGRPTKPESKPGIIEGEYKQVLPIAQYSAAYTYGDVRFAESFPIEGPSGEYLGECGIETSELVSSGDPPKVGAFEAWLFDKDMNRTVSKVITIPRADEAMRANLKAISMSGEVVSAEKGGKLKLETENLEAQLTIKDVEFGDEGTFFTRFAVSFEIFKKQPTQK